MRKHLRKDREGWYCVLRPRLVLPDTVYRRIRDAMAEYNVSESNAVEILLAQYAGLLDASYPSRYPQAAPTAEARAARAEAAS